MFFKKPGSIMAMIGAFLLLVSFIVIDLEKIDAGEVGVFKYQPYFWGKGGVDPTILHGPNRAFMWRSTSLMPVKTVPLTITVHAEDFMAQDRIPLDFDIAITFRVTDPLKAPIMIDTFGDGPVYAFRTLVLQQTEGGAPTGELMSFLRDQVRHHHSAVFIAAQTENGQESSDASAVETATRDYINQFLTKKGAGMVQVENIAMGRANPPEGVSKQIAATAQQEQEVKTQAARQRAAVSRKNAETEVANADMAYLNRMGLTTDQFVELQRLKMMHEVCTGGSQCILTTSPMPLALSPNGFGAPPKKPGKPEANQDTKTEK